jgi:hypothetical protein
MSSVVSGYNVAVGINTNAYTFLEYTSFQQHIQATAPATFMKAYHAIAE